ncbi:tail fiber protein [Aequorivita viscosa]|nr:tail fiber protein [Aequorivita viscosa]
MEPFIGQIVMFGGNFAPRSWAFCDGQLLAIAQNTALFSILGTTYGGDGRTTFALPDLRGRVAMHPGNGPGLSQRRLGESGGAETHVLNITQMPSHNHPVVLNAKEEGDIDDPANAYVAGDGTNAFGATQDVAMAAPTMGNTGGGQAHNNIQPYTCVNYIIALQGIFPSRN